MHVQWRNLNVYLLLHMCTRDVKKLLDQRASFMAASSSRRSTHTAPVKCNYVAIGEVWMRMWQFMGDVVLMDGNQATPSSPHTPPTLSKALVQIRINEGWRDGG